MARNRRGGQRRSLHRNPGYNSQRCLTCAWRGVLTAQFVELKRAGTVSDEYTGFITGSNEMWVGIAQFENGQCIGYIAIPHGNIEAVVGLLNDAERKRLIQESVAAQMAQARGVPRDPAAAAERDIADIADMARALQSQAEAAGYPGFIDDSVTEAMRDDEDALARAEADIAEPDENPFEEDEEDAD